MRLSHFSAGGTATASLRGEQLDEGDSGDGALDVGALGRTGNRKCEDERQDEANEAWRSSTRSLGDG